jgi:hypothetical protein
MRFPLSKLVVMLAFFGTAAGNAQVVPATPKKFATRSIGGNGVNAGITTIPTKTPPKARYTTHFILSDSRPWTGTDGKVLTGKLLAFEDMVVETPQGSAPTTAPTPPAHPTLVRDGKIRLLIDSKVFEVLLEHLSQADRDFVEQTRASYEKKKE